MYRFFYYTYYGDFMKIYVDIVMIINFMHHSNIAVAPKPLASKAMRLVL